MNKTAIKNFAVWARNKLIADITYKAGLLGITEKEIKSPLPQSTQTVQFFNIGTKEPYSITGVEIEQRKKLVEEIQRKANQADYKTAYKNVVEEVAYTWFNRLIAVRFMEVNDYLPTHIRVLSSESSNKSEPDLVTNPFDADLEYTPYEKDRIIQLKNDNQLDELFRMLFIKQCNALNAILPELFEKTNDYTELLMNVSFIDQDGMVYHLVNNISEDDFNVEKEGQVEIIGWLYQYYNTEPKDETFALLKKNVKIAKERIPAATQLFTPDWIVRYMVENSLGRLWLEGHPNDELKAQWKYYLDEAQQEAVVQKQLDIIREEYKTIKPEDIKVIDPCMGSGHILVYAFDVLMQIYESYGYSKRDAAKSIIENNLYGLDIDNRAYQLAYFAVMMKARQYNRRVMDGETTCHVYAIKESNGIKRSQINYLGHGMNDLERNNVLNQINYLLDAMSNAKEYGSILTIDNLDWDLLYHFLRKVKVDGQLTFDAVGLSDTQQKLHQLVEIAFVMSQQYDIVVTNPPYMGSSGMNVKLSEFVKKNYVDTKYDMSTVFMEKTLLMCKSSGMMSMINIPVWMFLSSFEKLRSNILSNNTIINMVHFGRGVFGSDFGTTSFVISKQHFKNYISSYRRLFERSGAVDSVEQKEQWFLAGKGKYATNQGNFSKLPSMPIAYWVNDNIFDVYSNSEELFKYAEPKSGIMTGNNEEFMRFWFEVSVNRINFNCLNVEGTVTNLTKWYPYNKGGEFRKWYGNHFYIVNMQNKGYEIANSGKNNNYRLRDPEFYFKKGISWTALTNYKFNGRYCPPSMLCDSKGPLCYVYNENNINAILALINSRVAEEFFKFSAPTMDFNLVSLGKTPVYTSIFNNQINDLTNDNINISKEDWDNFEISWNFQKHPFCKYFHVFGRVIKLESVYSMWKTETEKRFDQLKSNEEELNRIFIDIYKLRDELTPEVQDKDVNIRKADLGRDIRTLISYAVGCMFGRYSLDVDGLIFVGGEWDDSKFSIFIPDKDNILPITDEEYFKDDIVGLFCAFLKKAFGEETLEGNLDFIAKALGNKGNSSREVIRNYFLKDFFKDHCKAYHKLPIYWLFDSGKEDGFKALVYMHRYNEDTIGNLRIDYLHRIQRVYESEISRMQETIDNSKDAREVSAATKRKEKLVRQLKETKEYDEKIAHLAFARIAIDLDDGVKVNYEKVQTGTDDKKLQVLAKI